MGFDAPSTDLNDVQQGQALPVLPAPNSALAAIAPIVQGVPDLQTAVAQAFLKHTAMIAENSPLTQKTKEIEQQKAQTAATPLGQPSASAPPTAPSAGTGSFSDKLSGALGDAAHASDTKGGWLTGVTNTLNARNQRLAQAARDEQLHAKNQAETVALNRNIWRQDEELRSKYIDDRKSYYAGREKNYDGESDISREEALKLAADPEWVKNHFMDITGQVPVVDGNGEVQKKDGIPVMTPTFSWSSRTPKAGTVGSVDEKLTAEEAADAAKYGISKMPAGSPLTDGQHRSIQNAIVGTRLAVESVNNANGKPMTPEQEKAASPYLTDPTVQAAIAEGGGIPYVGIQKHIQNADAHIAQAQADLQVAQKKGDIRGAQNAVQLFKDATTEKNKLTAFSTVAISDKQKDDYEKKQEKDIGWVDKILHDPTSLSGDKASGVVPQLQEALKTETDPGRKAKLTSAIDAATMARDNYFEDMKRKANADQLAKQGDPATAGRMLAKGDVTLADLRTRQTTTDFLEEAITEAQKIDNNYNPADEVNFEHIAKSPQNAIFMGSARSLLFKGGTLDQLMDWGKMIPANSLPTLNTVEDWIKLKEGKGPLAGYAALVLGVADDYGKVMGGGSASDSARDAALHLFSAAATPKQREDAVRATLGGVGSQFDQRIGNNRFLQREYGNFVRSPLSPASESSQVQTQAAAAKLAQAHSSDVQRPKDLPTATNTIEMKNNKTGQTQTFWADVSGKPLRAVAPGELPKE